MNNYVLTLYNSLVFLRNIIIPKYLLERTNPELLGIDDFMVEVSKTIKPTDRILDAGAGTCPYKKYFSHAHYESTDFKNIFVKDPTIKHNFICSIDNIPKPDNYYDVIINTQVLEHVEFPQKVMNEFYRILKPGGKLFLTAPQGWGVHGSPYHFYNFTNFGLKSLFINSGFKIVYIRPRGGIFWYLGDRIRTFPSYVFFQYLFKKKGQHLEFTPKIQALFIFPFFLILWPLCSFLTPLLLFYLDFLDSEKAFTLGYNCYCIKK